MQVQIFGAVSSPTVCSYVLRRAAEDAGKHAESVLKQVLNNFYVDNWLSSFRSVPEAIETVKITTEALHRGGFELSQWGSSHSEILSLQGQEVRTVLDLNLDNLPMARTLGLWWVSSDDVFRIRFNINPSGNTKRQLLRTLASIFDPIGFFVPVTLIAKVLIQEVWRGNFDWDDELPSVLTEKWKRWITSFEKCPQINIHRCLTPVDGYWSRADLHVFANASESGFGAVSYLRFETNYEVMISLIMAKSRVAPLKLVTIPRLKLCAAVMATRLAATIQQER